MKVEEKTTEQQFLLDSGMVNRAVYAGLQADACVVWKAVPGGGFQNTSLCNHSCVIEFDGMPTGGNYVCASSSVMNMGAKAFFAPQNVFMGWVKNVTRAQQIARAMFFASHFNRYCERFHIPPAWAHAIETEIKSPDKKVELNLFGGSPEMRRDITSIIAEGKEMGLVVNLTTTGRRFLMDRVFTQEFAVNPANMLAVSFDDIGAEELARMAVMDPDELYAEWRSVMKAEPHHGQRHKAYEGLWAARRLRGMNVPVTVLFNMVIHPGNVSHFTSLLDVLGELVPGSFANPYPAQAFDNDPVCWTLESLPALREHILYLIERTLGPQQGVTRRLHYYIALEAAFRLWEKKDPERLIRFMSGIDAWDCTLRPGAYTYAQIGKSPQVFHAPYEQLPRPGGHMGCYWSDGWAFVEQVDGNPAELARAMLTGVGERGRKMPTVRKSNLMPRLMFDQKTTELGLPEELVSQYLSTREEFAGF